LKAMEETDKIRYAEWLLALFQVRGEAGPIIHRVSQAEDGSEEEKFATFLEALEKLPPILERLKVAPQLEGINMKKLRGIQELEVKAVEDYITSCELSIEQLKSPNSLRYSAIVLKLSLASKYWEMSAKEAVAFLRKLRFSPEESNAFLRKLGF